MPKVLLGRQTRITTYRQRQARKTQNRMRKSLLEDEKPPEAERGDGFPEMGTECSLESTSRLHRLSRSNEKEARGRQKIIARS